MGWGPPFPEPVLAADRAHAGLAIGDPAPLPFCHLILKAEKSMAYPKEPKTLGDHLKKRRCELGLLQKQAAARLRVSESTVWDWEHEVYPPAIEHVPAIIAFLGYDPSSAPQSVAERIVTARRRLGLPQRKLAEKLGISKATLGRWETGKTHPRGRRRKMAEQFLRSGV